MPGELEVVENRPSGASLWACWGLFAGFDGIHILCVTHWIATLDSALQTEYALIDTGTH